MTAHRDSPVSLDTASLRSRTTAISLGVSPSQAVSRRISASVEESWLSTLSARTRLEASAPALGVSGSAPRLRLGD